MGIFAQAYKKSNRYDSNYTFIMIASNYIFIMIAIVHFL